MKARSKKIAVVGAGWAGCAAAVELALHGHAVHLLESSRFLGGRARALEPADAAGPADHDWTAGLDNGQHILLGAYTETLRLMRIVGVDAGAGFLRLPLQMRYPPGSGGMDFRCPRLPAPLHLAVALWRATGLGRDDKMALARFTTAARWIDWRLNVDCTVEALLERFEQTARVTALLWRPLCLAALNTPPAQASAQVFLNVLRDSLGARRAASDMLLPRRDLGALLPHPAALFVQRHGGEVRTSARVTGVTGAAGRWQLQFAGASPGGGPVPADAAGAPDGYDHVILATPSTVTARLLAGLATDAGPDCPEGPGEQSPGTDQAIPDAPATHEAITTCYLKYAPSLSLTLPFYALRDEPALEHWGQFVFDRGHLDPAWRGVLAVVVSAASDVIGLDRQQLASAIACQLASAFGMPALAKPDACRIISEKRATFSCTPGLRRPGLKTGVQGILRAGDYVAGDYPATIESAVRSGIAAARSIGPG